jgi:hypothetical protein
MLKSVLLISLLLCSLIVSSIYGNPFHLDEQSSSSSVTFIKSDPNKIRRINPLKLFFTIVHNPTQSPHYSIEWNLPFLKVMLLESTQVSDDDKTLFLMNFSNIENDYPQWSEEQHNQLERFTEKYFNVFSSPDSFLPFIDCPALTYAITDEMLNVLQPNSDEEKRSKVRTTAIQRLCNSE